MNGYLALGLAIASEVFGTTMLKLSAGFTFFLPSLFFLLAFIASFYLLAIALKSLPLSLSYAIWSGVGTVVTTMIGIILWQDPFNILILIGILLIISGVFLLNVSNSSLANKGSSD